MLVVIVIMDMQKKTFIIFYFILLCLYMYFTAVHCIAFALYSDPGMHIVNPHTLASPLFTRVSRMDSVR